MMAQVTSQSSYVQGALVVDREGLMDRRDELASMVKAKKLEMRRAIERRRSHGSGSATEMWQMLAAIGQGQSQIEVIDLHLQSISTY